MASIISAGTTSGTSLNLSADTSGVLQLATNGTTTAVTIDTSQNVGIGTSSPTADLDILRGNEEVRIQLNNTNSGTGTTSGLAFILGADGVTSYIAAYESAATVNVYVSGATRTITNTYGIGLGDSSAPTSGMGIRFPATQSASSDANTLDDYEEGTFTPTIAGTSTTGTASYFQQVGSYTKIGNVVTCNFHLNWSGGTGTGNLLIINLPFLSANNNNFASASFYYSSINYTAGNTPQAYLQFNDNRITFEQVAGNSTSTSIAYDAAGVIVGTLVYRSA